MKVKVSVGTLSDICSQRIAHILKKNADYGDAWQNNEGFTPLLRMREKLLRVETLSDGRKAMVEDETVDQDVAEIFDYALLYMLWKAWQPKLDAEEKAAQAGQLSFEELGNLLKGISDETIEKVNKDYINHVTIMFGVPVEFIYGKTKLDSADASDTDAGEDTKRSE